MTGPDEALRTAVEDEIRAALRRLKRDYAEYGAAGIVDEVEAALYPAGKRMRPVLCCWGHQACGGDLSRPIVKAAASLELLHTFALVHDDIMDSPGSRRRQSPAHSRAAAAQGGLKTREDAKRLGVSIALLAGDLALVASDQLLVESGFPPEKVASAWEPLSRMRLDAVAGQYLDLTLSGEEISSEAAATIARLKSGSYSVRGPLAMGAVLAGAGLPARQALDSFGESLGEAFQLTDDLLGMFGDPAISGKDAGLDLKQGKPTLLVATALELSTGGSRRTLKAALGNPKATPRQAEAAREAILESGAAGSTAERIRTLVARAKSALDDPPSKGLEAGPCLQLANLADTILQQAEEAIG